MTSVFSNLVISAGKGFGSVQIQELGLYIMQDATLHVVTSSDLFRHLGLNIQILIKTFGACPPNTH